MRTKQTTLDTSTQSAHDHCPLCGTVLASNLPRHLPDCPGGDQL